MTNIWVQRYESGLASLARIPTAFWRQLLIVFALLWFVHSLAKLVWVFLPAPAIKLPPVIAAQKVDDVSSGSAYSVDVASLQQKLFGDGVVAPPLVEEAPQVQPGIENNAAKTNLRLKLVGLLASSDNTEASAVIANGNNQDIYQIDDKLPVGNNVTLAKVLSDRVILSNSGKYESLWLYSEGDFKVKYSYSNNNSQSRPQRGTERGAPLQPIQAKIRPSEIPKSISDVVRFSVHRENGQMLGFRIRPGKDKALFEKLGLQANDIVTSVNGIAIDNAQAIRDNYQQLKNAPSADLEIRRGEEVVYVNVTLDTVSE